MSRLLIDEPPLQVLPSLAVAIGLNEALVLQQFHYWLQRSQHEHDGRKWIYNTFEVWQQQFPFWSLRTIKTVIGNLEKTGLVLTGNYNAHSWDRTKWYSIDYDKIRELELSTPVSPAAPSTVQDLHDASGNLRPMHQADPARSSSPETTAETTDREQQQDAELLLFIADVAQGLEDEGIAPKTALELARRDPDLAADWLEAKREWQGARDPAGLLVAKIRAGEQPPRPRRLRGFR